MALGEHNGCNRRQGARQPLQEISFSTRCITLWLSYLSGNLPALEGFYWAQRPEGFFCAFFHCFFFRQARTFSAGILVKHVDG